MNTIREVILDEARRAAEQLGCGATLVGALRYANRAHFDQAMFSLGAGLTRAAKLVFVLQYAFDHDGHMPQKAIRHRAGDLSSLLADVDKVAKRFNMPKNVALNRTEIHESMLSILTRFAAASTVYYDLSIPARETDISPRENLCQEWVNTVVKPILRRHYSVEQRKSQHQIVTLIADIAASPPSIRGGSGRLYPCGPDGTRQSVGSPVRIAICAIPGRTAERTKRGVRAGKTERRSRSVQHLCPIRRG